jgi:dipeptidyl aminopeptidase/acylaminoacyl peptidase
MQRSRGLLALVLVVCAATASAHAEPPQRTHDITVDDYFTLATPFNVALSPDGKYAAYSEGRWQQSTDDRKTDLWVVETKSKRTRRLTSDRANDRSPQWSADGRTVYFLGNRKREGEKRPPYDGTTQVWRINRESGGPSPVTRVESGVNLFGLAHNGATLFYTTDGEHSEGDWQELKHRFKDVDYGHGSSKVSRVWKLDLESWRSEVIVDEKRYIYDLAVWDNGGKLAMITGPDDRVITFEGQSRVDVYDADSRKTTTVPDKLYHTEAASPYGWLEHLAWSPDGKSLAFNVIFDGHPTEIIVAEWDSDGPPATYRVKRPEGLSIKGYGSPVAWRAPAELFFLAEEKARVRLVSINQERGAKLGEMHVWTPGDVVVEQFHLNAADGQAAAILNGPADHFMEVYLVDGSDKPTRLTNLNPQSETWKLPRLSTVSWKGAKGVTVEGVLELPPDAKEGQKLPLIVEIHGGPTVASYYRLEFAPWGSTLLASHGYAMLHPNYRGSTGYGDKFLTDLVGHENDLDVKDILAGADALVEKGVADPERLGVMGWSNGGYLTNCIIATTTRFKAASSGAGIVDTVMEWGSNDEPAYSLAMKGGFPWNRSEAYHKASPTYELNKVKTPTIIHVGGADERCPPAHSRMLYRALKEYVKVPTELLVYTGEPHGPTKYKNRKAKMEWDLAWFDRYILGKKGK